MNEFLNGMNSCSGQRPFRFWCQTVLPLVYDESLSYYELLCKVVNYLNNTISDITVLEGNIQSVVKSFAELRGYVDNYFKNIDVQDEIDNKLDEMAASGELGSILLAITSSPINGINVGREIVPPSSWDYDTNLYYLDYASWIEKWDRLVAATPLRKVVSNYNTVSPTDEEILSRHLPGSFPETPLVYYEWTPRIEGLTTSGNVENFNNSNESTPGFFVVGGMHGNEKQGPYAFYQLFKSWTEGRNYGRYMLDNFRFIIVPCANPYGWHYNTRNNERGVNINRNFPYGWDEHVAPEYGNNGKGAHALSERSAQFLNSMIQEYRKPKYRSGMVEIDLHGFHRDLHKDDRRVLWIVSNDYELKRSSLRIASFLHEKIVARYPELDNGNPFIAWSSQVSTPNFDNECRVNGIRSMVFEFPQRFTGNSSTASTTEYDEKSAWISALIAPNLFINISDVCFENWQNKQYNRSPQIGMNIDAVSLSGIAEQLTNGGSITLSVAANSVLQNELPGISGEQEYGILQAWNNGSVTMSPATVFKWTICTTNHSYTWYKTVSTKGREHPWVRADSGYYSLDDIVGRINALAGENTTTIANVTIEQIMDALPTDCTCEVYVNNTDTPALYSYTNALGYIRFSNPQSKFTHKLAVFTRATNGATKIWTYDGELHDVPMFSGNYRFRDFSYGTFAEYVSALPGGSHVSDYLHSTTPLGKTGPANVNGLYTLDIVDAGNSKFARLVFTTTSSNHRMFYTRVTESSMDSWSEITLT